MLIHESVGMGIEEAVAAARNAGLRQYIQFAGRQMRFLPLV